MPAFLGAGVAIVVGLGVVLTRGGDKPAEKGAAPPPPVVQPAAAPKPVVSNLQLSAAKAGKTPTTKPPELTAATLQELDALLLRIKTLRNESVTARAGSSDNQTARAKMGEAYKLCEEWQQKIDAPLRWQENAQMEDWAQPAEYVTLEKMFATFQKLNNEVRKGGGG
jgi:hypothetical protein